jgi:hypothetical protein
MFYRFIASQICLHCLNDLRKKNITQRSDEAMIFFASLKKFLYFRIFRNEAEKLRRLCFYIRVGKFCTVKCDFCMNSHNVDSGEAMKQ